MKIDIYNTNRLSLSKVTAETLDFVFQTYTDEEQLEFFSFSNTDELAEQKEKWKRGMSTHNKKLLYFHLIEKETKNTIGWCGYHTWYTDHDRAEIGYGIFQDIEKRKGFMTEALEFILDYGFREMQLHRIEAMASPNNVPSLRLLEKFNFKKEGHLKEHYLMDGIYEDSLVFSLLKEF